MVSDRKLKKQKSKKLLEKRDGFDSVDLNLLKKNKQMQGWLKKTARSKGEDKFLKKNKWTDRWFVLDGKQLKYYKRKRDNTEKGTIDLEAAKIDDAEEITNRPFTFRIAEAGQIFMYVQAPTKEDKKEWMDILRKVSGYVPIDEQIRLHKKKKEDGIIVDQELKYNAHEPSFKLKQVDNSCCYGLLFRRNVEEDHDRLVLIFDISGTGGINIACDGEIVSSYSSRTIKNAAFSTKVDDILEDDTQLYPLTINFKKDPSKVFHLPSRTSAKEMAQLLNELACADFRKIKTKIATKPQWKGYATMRVKSSLDWGKYWVAVYEKRLVLYHSKKSAYPIWSIGLNQRMKLKSEGKKEISLQSDLDHVIFKVQTKEERNEMLRAIKLSSTTLEDQINRDLKRLEVKKKMQEAENKDYYFEGGVDLAFDLEGDADSFVVSWGNGQDGQLGVREKVDLLCEPMVIDSLAKRKVRFVAAGNTFCGAVTSKGLVFMWGRGEEGQLGLGPAVRYSKSPYLIISMRQTPIAQFSCGRAHVIAVAQNGDLYSWGANAKGQLGIDSQNNSFKPQLIEKLERQRIQYFSAGGDFSACITGSDELYTWGDNHSGQLGLGSRTDHLVPEYNTISEKGTPVIVECGVNFTAIVMEDGRLYTCGNNKYGQLGHGDKKSRKLPKLVKTLNDAGWEVYKVECGKQHIVTLSDTAELQGVLHSWGSPRFNGSEEERLLPEEVELIENEVRFLSSSSSHTLVVGKSCELVGFGKNFNGELGNGDTEEEEEPVRISLNSICKVAQSCCGEGFSMALIKGKPPSMLTLGKTEKIVRKTKNLAFNDFDFKLNTDTAKELDTSDAFAKVQDLLKAVKRAETTEPGAKVKKKKVVNYVVNREEDDFDEDEKEIITIDSSIVERLDGGIVIDSSTVEEVSPRKKKGIEIENIKPPKKRSKKKKKKKKKKKRVSSSSSNSDSEYEKRKKSKSKSSKKKVSGSSDDDGQSTTEDEDSEGEWIETKDTKGRTYYYHSITQESRWTLPK